MKYQPNSDWLRDHLSREDVLSDPLRIDEQLQYIRPEQETDGLTDEQRAAVDMLLADKDKRARLIQKPEFNQRIRQAIVRPEVDGRLITPRIALLLVMQDHETVYQVQDFPLGRVMERLDMIGLADGAALSWSARYLIRQVVTGGGDFVDPTDTTLHIAPNTVVFDRDQYIIDHGV